MLAQVALRFLMSLKTPPAPWPHISGSAALTVDAVQTRGLDETAGRTGKVIPKRSVGCNDGIHLGRGRAADGQDYLEMRILLLQVHQRPQAALNAVHRSPRVSPFVAQLDAARRVSEGRALRHTKTSTHKHTAIWRNAGIGVVDMVDATVIEHARAVAVVYARVGKVDSVGVHDSGHVGRMPRPAHLDEQAKNKKTDTG